MEEALAGADVPAVLAAVPSAAEPAGGPGLAVRDMAVSGEALLAAERVAAGGPEVSAELEEEALAAGVPAVLEAAPLGEALAGAAECAAAAAADSR